MQPASYPDMPRITLTTVLLVVVMVLGILTTVFTGALFLRQPVTSTSISTETFVSTSTQTTTSTSVSSTTSTTSTTITSITTTNTASPNQYSVWAGWIGTTAYQSMVSVSAMFTIPTLNCNTPFAGYSSVTYWVGLDGYGMSDIEQIGVAATCTGSFPSYWSWYELYPQAAIDINNTIPVYGGNTVTISVIYSSGNFQLSFLNWSNHQSVVENYHNSTVSDSTAECVIEQPTLTLNNGALQFLNLANFGSVMFQSCNMQSTAAIQYINVNMYNAQNQILAQVVSGTNTSFEIVWEQQK